MAPYTILNSNDGSLGVLGEEADLSVCFLGGGKARSAKSTSVRERNDGRRDARKHQVLSGGLDKGGGPVSSNLKRQHE